MIGDQKIGIGTPIFIKNDVKIIKIGQFFLKLQNIDLIQICSKLGLTELDSPYITKILGISMFYNFKKNCPILMFYISFLMKMGVPIQTFWSPITHNAPFLW